MTIKSTWTVSIPEQTLPDWLFGSPDAPVPEKPQFIDPENPDTRFLTLAGYRRWAMRVASGLIRKGVKPGDRILVIAGNVLSLPPVFMGILMAGAIFVSANPAKPVDSLAYQTQLVDPKLVIASSAVLENVKAAATTAKIPLEDVYELDESALFDEPATSSHKPHWTSLVSSPEKGESFDWRKTCNDNTSLAAMAFTSGSTGAPKAVQITHRNLVANSTQFMHLMHQDPEEPNKRPSMKWVGWLPLFGVFGMTQFMLTGPKRQIPNYLMKGWDLELLLKNIQKYRPTELFLAPAMVLMLAHHPKTRETDLSSIRSVPIGGAPLSKAHYDMLMDLLPHRPLAICNGYGSSEATCLALYWSPLDTGFSTSCGELMPNVQGRVVSLDGMNTVLGTGQSGEVYFKGPIVAGGYWKQPEKTVETFMEDGWLKSGDYGYYDASGKWYITERIKELIHGYNGKMIVPTDIEAALYAAPGVIDAGVVGLPAPNESTLTIPKAFVVLKDQASTTQDQLKAILVDKFGDSCRFDQDIAFADKLPKLPNGKVDRDSLRKMLNQGTA